MTAAAEPVVANIVEPAATVVGPLAEPATETVRSADPLVSAADTATAAATRPEAAQQTLETAAGSSGSVSEVVPLAVGGNAGAGPPGPPTGGAPALDSLPAAGSDPVPMAGDHTLAAGLVESGAADEASFVDVLGQIAPSGDNRALVTAGIVTLAGAAFFGRASGPCLSSASVMLTNVRLMPCMAAEVVSRSVAVAQSAAGSISGSVGGSSTGSSADSNKGSRHRSFGETLEDLGQELRDGFMHGAGRLADEVSEADRDATLLRQLGYGLGFVYAAFLVVWLWATRIRWQVRER